MALKYINEDGTEIEEHDITLKIEVLLEFIAGVKADLGRFMDAKNIDIEKDLSNPLTTIYWDLVKMRKQLFKVETMEEIMAIQNKIIYIKDLVKQIEENK